MAETTIADKIEDNAKGPARVTVDGSTVQQHDINQQIAANKHRSQQAALSKNHVGITFRQMIPGAAG